MATIIGREGSNVKAQVLSSLSVKRNDASSPKDVQKENL
jgi:hypothetical protein